LGIILYCLLTGSLPFDDDDESKMMEKILIGYFEVPDWLSPGACLGILGVFHELIYRA
jgi:serine/threonine protein kinase